MRYWKSFLTIDGSPRKVRVYRERIGRNEVFQNGKWEPLSGFCIILGRETITEEEAAMIVFEVRA